MPRLIYSTVKHKEKNTLPHFEPISSAPDSAMNFLFISSMLSTILAVPVMSIFLIFNPNDKSVDGYFIFYVILFNVVLIAVVIIVFIYENKRAFTDTIIDEKGIRYYNKFKGVVVKDLPWSSFVKSEKTSYDLIYPKYDIWSRTEGVVNRRSLFEKFFWRILVGKKIILHKDLFRGRHFFCMFYSNRLELIRTFLLGVSYYKSDLTVDPNVFREQYIDPETFVIDYKTKSRVSIIACFFAILIIIVIFFL